MPTNRMKNGDVLLLTDGRILQIVDTKVDWSGYAMVEFIDRGEHSYLDLGELEVEHNLGQSSAILMNFHATHSLHIRLNRMAKV